MQAPPPPPPETPSRSRFGRSGRLFFLVWSPSHLHECLRLSVLHTPPLCPMFANVSLFFFAIPHLTVPLLGSVGRSNRSFCAIDALPFEGPTPLSSPKYPSLTFPPPKPCVSCLLPSLGTTFAFFTPPFATFPLPLLRVPPTVLSFPAV